MSEERAVWCVAEGADVTEHAKDEIKALATIHGTLMRLSPEARRRVVRYMVERHVSATEPEERQETAPEPSEEARRGVYTAADSIAEAKRHMEASA